MPWGRDVRHRRRRSGADCRHPHSWRRASLRPAHRRHAPRRPQRFDDRPGRAVARTRSQAAPSSPPTTAPRSASAGRAGTLNRDSQPGQSRGTLNRDTQRSTSAVPANRRPFSRGLWLMQFPPFDSSTLGLPLRRPAGHVGGHHELPQEGRGHSKVTVPVECPRPVTRPAGRPWGRGGRRGALGRRRRRRR